MIGREFGASVSGTPATRHAECRDIRRDATRCGAVRRGAGRRDGDRCRRSVSSASRTRNRDAVVCRRARQPAPHWPPPHITPSEHVRGLPPRSTRRAAMLARASRGPRESDSQPSPPPPPPACFADACARHTRITAHTCVRGHARQRERIKQYIYENCKTV